MDTIEINIKSNAPEVTKETTGLRQQVKELRKEMESCVVGSDEYNAALAKLATTTHDLREQQEAVKNSAGDLGTALSNIQSVGTGIVSGFSAINAVMALTGSHSEDLQKAMVSLQAGIALVQGMKGLEGLPKKINATITSLQSLFVATTAETAANGALATSEGLLATVTKGLSNAFKGLKAALLSSGIGGIIVLVGSLVAGMTALVGVIRNNLQAENEFKETNDKLNESFATQNEALDLQIKYLEADGASTTDIINAKRDLVREQKAETQAALDNAKARLTQLKNDSAWRRFWHGENKVIKEMEKETIPALEATLEKLNKQEANFNADLYKEGKRVANAAKKEAESVAKTISDNAKKAGEDVKKQLADIVKNYSKTINSIRSINNLLDAKTIQSAITSDIDAWMTVYGTDPKKMQTSLSGTLSALIGYAYDEAVKVRDAAIKKAKNDKEVDEINKAFNEALDDIYHAAYPEAEAVGIRLGTTLTEGVTAPMQESKAISETFTSQFNALNQLYEEGIIDYKEFYDTLINIQDDYKIAVEDFEAQYIDETKQSSEYVAQLRYQYALKPLAFQKEVGEKFLKELDKQFKVIEGKTKDSYSEINKITKSALEEEAARTSKWYKFWVLIDSQTLEERYNNQVESLKKQKDIYDQEYEAKKSKIEELLLLDALTIEQEQQLRDQLKTLNDEKLQNDIAYYENSAAARDDYYSSLQDAVSQGFSAFNDLSKNMADVFKGAAEQMKDEEGNYTAAGKKMLKTSAALQIANATMTAAAGIATVWAQSATLGPIAGPIVAGIQTAAHLANLAVQISTIQKSLSDGLAGNTSGGGESDNPPDTSFTLTNPDAYQTTLSDETQADLQANAQKNSRVYVVSSDITDAQNNEKTTVTTSTF